MIRRVKNRRWHWKPKCQKALGVARQLVNIKEKIYLSVELKGRYKQQFELNTFNITSSAVDTVAALEKHLRKGKRSAMNFDDFIEEFKLRYEYETDWTKIHLEVSILEWLKRHLITDELPSSAKKRFEDLNNSEVNRIISEAYMDVLEWDPQHLFPETLKV
ncbi:unnamed protein product [Gongylonema pulchrum]|uniref:DUF4065 domain-containing protein n=1 Tax=Gongylonema pulchrum TaxID=637853 RepID=A0A183E3H5_9BILA|nr:unnamed protein product [Gongylonema pulchrum]